MPKSARRPGLAHPVALARREPGRHAEPVAAHQRVSPLHRPRTREAEAVDGERRYVGADAEQLARGLVGHHGPQVFVEVASPTGVILHSEVVTLLFGGAWTNERYPPYPSVAVVFGLEQIGIQNGTETVRVRLEPVEPGMRYWAFATVTNNETQHVTTITPQ